MVDLLDPSDPDWVSFLRKDPAWFLKVAGREIRRYCGWHVYPGRVVTESQLEIGAKGIITLPSRYVTDVSNVTVFPQSLTAQTLTYPNDYLWFKGGWIERLGYPYWGELYTGYYYGNDPYYLRVWQAGWASVTFTHGYDQVPDDIKEVAFELASTTVRNSGGNAKEINTPGFKLTLTQPYGATLNQDQKNRLANYRIGGTK